MASTMKSRHSRNRTWGKRTLITLTVLALIVGGGTGYFYWKAYQSFSSIKRENLLPTGNSSGNAREKTKDPSAGQPITYLLLGSDTRGNGDKGRSDSIMMAYIPKDRKHMYLVSFPRDLYVEIPGHDKQKINAAYELGGAPLTVQTVQNFTGYMIDHVALIDFNSFISMVDSLGGITINNPYGGCDTSQHVCFKKGKITLNREDALHYVRWRHGLPNGDITRSQNQQRVVRAIAAKMMSGGVLANPVKLNEVLGKTSEWVTVDSTLTNDMIRDTALNMNLGSSNDIRSITAPISGYADVPTYGDVDLVDEAKMQELRKALADDTMDAYWEKHHNDPVAGASTVGENNVAQHPGG